MKKTILVAMAALALLFSSSVSCAAGTCRDWKGTWTFGYNSATTTKICVDKTTVTSDEALRFCQDGFASCTCFDNASNATRERICFDNASSIISICDNASTPGCFCAKNPLYRKPSVGNGQYEVNISDVQDNATQGTQKFTCLATGKRDTQDITIAQPDAATLAAFAGYYPNADPSSQPNNGSYLYFEGSAGSLAELPYATINADGFDGINFSPETDYLNYNLYGLAGGLKCIDNDNDGYGVNCAAGPDCDDNDSDVHINCNCIVNVLPKTIYRLFTFFMPFSYYMIGSANSELEFEYPISIDFLPLGGMDDIVLIKIGPRLIFGLLLLRPFMLEPVDYEVVLKFSDQYGDMNKCTGMIKVQ